MSNKQFKKYTIMPGNSQKVYIWKVIACQISLTVPKKNWLHFKD